MCTMAQRVCTLIFWCFNDWNDSRKTQSLIRNLEMNEIVRRRYFQFTNFSKTSSRWRRSCKPRYFFVKASQRYGNFGTINTRVRAMLFIEILSSAIDFKLEFTKSSWNSMNLQEFKGSEINFAKTFIFRLVSLFVGIILLVRMIFKPDERSRTPQWNMQCFTLELLYYLDFNLINDCSCFN